MRAAIVRFVVEFVIILMLIGTFSVYALTGWIGVAIWLTVALVFWVASRPPRRQLPTRYRPSPLTVEWNGHTAVGTPIVIVEPCRAPVSIRDEVL